jgi:hypothetical protein
MTEQKPTVTSATRARRAARYAVIAGAVAASAVGGYLVGSSRSEQDDRPDGEAYEPPNCPMGGEGVCIPFEYAGLMCALTEIRERLDTGEVSSDDIPEAWVDGDVAADPAGDPVLVVDLRQLNPSLIEETEQSLRGWAEHELGIHLVPVIQDCMRDFDPETDWLVR